MQLRTILSIALAACIPLAASCGPDDDAQPEWAAVLQAPGAALLSVHGTTASDVWAVGADNGDGPLAVHWDGRAWHTLDTSGIRADLWWVHATDGGDVFAAGSDATILRIADDGISRMTTPGLGADTVFGLWAAAPNDMYAVGSRAARNGFIWHYDGTAWTSLLLPTDIPVDESSDIPGLFKVWGASADDVWAVGGGGLVLRGNAQDGFERVEAPTLERLFTVHAAHDEVVMVGGSASGVALYAQDDAPDPTQDGALTADAIAAPLLQGAWIDDGGTAWAVGLAGAVFARNDDQWTQVDTDLTLDVQSLHAVWTDPSGDVWAVGGNVLTSDLNAGVVVRYSDGLDPANAVVVEASTANVITACPDAQVDPVPDGSVARRWNEQLLQSIRRDVPRPTVHARNLYHVSVAMWDAWAAFDDVAVGHTTNAIATADDVDAARDEAISYAAYRVLSHRYVSAVGGDVSQDCYDRFMDVLGYDPANTTVTGDSPAALGNRIGNAVIDAFADDGANEQNDYADPDDWVPDTPRLVVDAPGTRAQTPTTWQQLVIAEAETQNGIPEGSGVREVVGAHWGAVTPFALVRPLPNTPYLDIGEPPTTLDDRLVNAAVDVIRKTSELDIHDGVTVDISPASYGDNPLGADTGDGYDQNPVTGAPYAPEPVLRGDFTRALAEFWADGPTSETPPGHWNTLANDVALHPDFERRLFGEGEPLEPLSWDVHMYLALNGAVHDAAIAAWELKRTYASSRPITLIRYMGGKGQRTNENGVSYHPEGLPLVDDLIEVITPESIAPGERHAHLARYVGEIAVRSWRGEPGDRVNELGDIGWIRAVEWTPYQRRNFVTPAFPGYISGHSTFSRAAAEVLTQLTGDAFFPGGMGGYTLAPGFLVFESGPSTAVNLQWARYYDAADQAGQSRLWGGIHVVHDDYDGRRVGDRVGNAAVDMAAAYFSGGAP